MTDTSSLFDIDPAELLDFVRTPRLTGHRELPGGFTLVLGSDGCDEVWYVYPPGRTRPVIREAFWDDYHGARARAVKRAAALAAKKRRGRPVPGPWLDHPFTEKR
jgi:hypothetical protein